MFRGSGRLLGICVLVIFVFSACGSDDSKNDEEIGGTQPTNAETKSDDPSDRVLRTGEQSTFTEPSTTSPLSAPPDSCAREEPEGGMTYDQMIDQQICARDLFLWPPAFYPVIEPSSNLSFVGGGFEEYYGYTPMRIAYSCAWTEWWYTAFTDDDRDLAISIETWLEGEGLSRLEQVTSYNPERALNTIDSINRFLDAARLEDLSEINSMRQGQCETWDWVQSPDFVVPAEFGDGLFLPSNRGVLV